MLRKALAKCSFSPPAEHDLVLPPIGLLLGRGRFPVFAYIHEPEIVKTYADEGKSGLRIA